MDQIILQGIDLSCHVGVTQDEREYTQPIIIDLVLYKDLSLVCKSDDVLHTVNYSEVFKVVRKCTVDEQYATIERLADKIASDILFAFPILKVKVKVKKPYALRAKGVRYAAVCIERGKNEDTK